jgi:UDP-N-acetyl-D-glucosamine dehydrogenase
VNIGLVNEMAIVRDKLGVDVWEVIEAKRPPFDSWPTPGSRRRPHSARPHYLAWKMRTPNYRTRFTSLWRDQRGDARVRVARVGTFERAGAAARGSQVLVISVAYKKDIGDIRESPALDVIRLLERRGAVVTYHDPHVPTFKEDDMEMKSVALTPESLKAADCVVVVTDHSAVDYAVVAKHARVVVDTRNALAKVRAK